MKKALVLILIMLIAFSMVYVVPIKAQSIQTIIIHSNGQVMPINAAIQRLGNVYFLTTSLTSAIIVEANNIILNGNGYTLKGPSASLTIGGIAVNITAINVTVENMIMTNWGVGVLGAWNNNTITNSIFTSNDEAIALYGDDYVVRQNSISNSTTAIFIDGGSQQDDHEIIVQNQITRNTQAFDITKSNGVTITANNIANNDAVLALGQTSGKIMLYSNNFVDNKQPLQIPVYSPSMAGVPTISPAGQWDNGTVGNYWSDYTTRYPGASEIGHTGVCDTPYTIVSSISYSDDYGNGTSITRTAVLGTATDNCPLLFPIDVPTATLAAVPSASPTVPEYPMWTVAAVLILMLSTAAFLSVRTKSFGKRLY